MKPKLRETVKPKKNRKKIKTKKLNSRPNELAKGVN